MLSAAAIIAKKRDLGELTKGEIYFMLDGFVRGEIPDYQMSAWAMAVLCRGMTDDEVAHLTDGMLDSGERLRPTSDRPRVDKHSTGGLGDKVSLILAPLVAYFDVDIPMLSGRGLGITGGTLDKLESFPGYNCQLTTAQIDRQLSELGCVITGTTAELAPADRKLYGLRDVTGTVPSIPLITASIMSKKLAASLDALVLDVKFGSGAFMRDLDSARRLAHSLTSTGQRLGVATSAVLSDMNQPLGRMVGNACEVNEALQVLQGEGPADVRALTLRLAAQLLVSVGRFDSLQGAMVSLGAALDAGKAYELFEAMVCRQGGMFSSQLTTAPAYELCADNSGWLEQLDGQVLGQTIIDLGGGRRELGDQLDHQVGVEMLVRVGDQISRGQPLLRIFARSAAAADQARNSLLPTFRLSPQPVPAKTLIVEP